MCIHDTCSSFVSELRLITAIPNLDFATFTLVGTQGVLAGCWLTLGPLFLQHKNVIEDIAAGSWGGQRHHFLKQKQTSLIKKTAYRNLKHRALTSCLFSILIWVLSHVFLHHLH